MMDRPVGYARVRTLQLIVLFIFFVIVVRLVYIQLINYDTYKLLSDRNVRKSDIKFAPRGEVLDRNGNYLVQSVDCYDIMVIYSELDKKGFDTATLCNIINISPEKLKRELSNARLHPRAPRMVTNFIPNEKRSLFIEYDFKGFYTVGRTARQYPKEVGGNLLGYVGEVSPEMIKRYPSYRAGDYIGLTGVESAYEPFLRGRDGVDIKEKDAYGAIHGDHSGGQRNTPLVPGKRITSTIDMRLQLFAEKLMRGKVGAIVAIEPSTGEILMMVSSPTYDPNELVGRERGNNYMEMLYNSRRPLFNRAVSSKYPPGSIFKLVQGLIALQEGVLRPNYRYSCRDGYTVGNLHMGCHPHRSPADLNYAIATSCNAYFCHVYRNILDNPKYGGVKDGFDVWKDYVESFGFGRKLGSDFLSEGSGYVPDRAFYDKRYRRSWNSLTVLSLSIGQGELGCTPLQMANLAAIIANRGYYYIPHVVKKIEGVDSLNSKFYEKNYVKVDARHFEPIIEGMWQGVNRSGVAWRPCILDLDVCGKTGTAENPHGKDHSTFLSFAPRNNPKIAMSVYVENGGFGASVALPIASLIEEYYLTDTIRRPHIQKYVENMKIEYPIYDKRE